jgi:hypothetical protein
VAIARTRVVDYHAEHRRGVLQLWRRFFGAWSAAGLARRWRWQFDDNPWAQERAPIVLVALHGDEVVGHLGGIPLPLRLDDARRVAICGSGMVLDDAHRLLAFQLAGRLLRSRPVVGSGLRPEAMRLFRKAGAQVVPGSRRRFTYPLSRAGRLARRIRERVPPWFMPLVSPAVLAPVGRLSALAHWVAPERPGVQALPQVAGKADIRPLARFDREYDALWDAARARVRCGLDKDATYMRWRYHACPTLAPIVRGLYSRRGRLDAVVVAIRRTELDWRMQPCVVHGEIAELVVRPDAVEHAEQLLATVVHELAATGADEVTATGMHADVAPAFAAVGFVEEDSDEFALGVLVDDEDAPRMHGLSADAWYTTAADGDALYAPGL